MASKAFRPMSWFKRFAAATRGATAVEFGFVALPFITLVFGVLELGLVFLVSTTLENATDAVSRKIRTGEFQNGGGSKASFATAICAEMSWLGSDCTSKLHLDVRTFPNFAGVSNHVNNPANTPTKPVDAAKPAGAKIFDDTKTQFIAGGPEDIVLVRVYYEWTLITPILNQGLETLSGGKRLISTTATFRNEPYGS